MTQLNISVCALLAMIASPLTLSAADASAVLSDVDGERIGTVELHETPHGTLLDVQLQNMPSGVSAFHIHEVGQCDPSFGHAGGHYNPEDANHGLLDAQGYHVGDMPNLHIPESGELRVEIFNAQLELDDRLFDQDGASIMIHAGADDYASDPSGAAGSRIACGEIVKLSQAR